MAKQVPWMVSDLGNIRTTKLDNQPQPLQGFGVLRSVRFEAGQKLSFEETAWQIWVAATCPVKSDQYPFVGLEELAAISFGATQGFSCEPVAATANPAELPYEKTANIREIIPSVTAAARLVPRLPY